MLDENVTCNKGSHLKLHLLPLFIRVEHVELAIIAADLLLGFLNGSSAVVLMTPPLDFGLFLSDGTLFDVDLRANLALVWRWIG